MDRVNRSAFICYARSADKRDQGFITAFCKHLSDEIGEVAGQHFNICIDVNIEWGKNWRRQISEYLEEATFLIIIVTPSLFNSKYCLEEVKTFLHKEDDLGRDDLILPIYYIEVSEESIKTNQKKYGIYKKIFNHNIQDLRDLRSKSIKSKEVQNRINELARYVNKRLNGMDCGLTSTGDTSMSVDVCFDEEIDDKCSYKHLSEKLCRVGLTSCDLKMKNGTTTKTALDDVKNSFSVMAATAIKFVDSSNFESVVKRCGSSSKENVKFLLADPDKHANTLKKRADTIPKCEDNKHIINSLIESLEIMAKYENFLQVRFYPEWLQPTFRAFFVDDRYVLVSFYLPTIRTTDTPQLKLSSESYISFYRPFRELFDIFWASGTDVDLDHYK